MGCFYNMIVLSDYQFIFNINSALWTIPIELYWSYALFLSFLVLKLVKRTAQKNILLCIITLLIIRFAPFKGNIFGLLFLMGALLAINYHFLISFFKGKMKILLLIGIIAITYFVDRNMLEEINRLPFKWSYLVAGLYILCAIAIPKIQNLFSNTFIHWLGRISFPLYLLHMLVLGSVSAWLYIHFPSLRAGWGLTGLLIIQLIFSLGIAHLFTVFVDEPLMRQFDLVYKKITNGRRSSEIKEVAV